MACEYIPKKIQIIPIFIILIIKSNFHFCCRIFLEKKNKRVRASPVEEIDNLNGGDEIEPTILKEFLMDMIFMKN